MTLIVDAGPVVASIDASDPRSLAVREALVDEPGRIVVPAPVTAEIDHLVRTRLGAEPARRFGEDVAARRYEVVCLSPDEHQLVVDLDRRYADLGLGLADLSVVLLAARFDTRRLLTFDERDFRAVEPLQGGSFTLLPADGRDR